MLLFQHRINILIVIVIWQKYILDVQKTSFWRLPNTFFLEDVIWFQVFLELRRIWYIFIILTRCFNPVHAVKYDTESSKNTDDYYDTNYNSHFRLISYDLPESLDISLDF